MAPPATRPDASEEPFPPPPGVPDSLIPHASHATTEPAPDAMVEALLERLQPSFDNIYTKLNELLGLRETDAARLRAIDAGVGSALTQVGLLEDVVKTNTKTCERVANGLFAVSKDLQDLRTSTIDQLSHDGEKVAELRQSVSDLEQRTSVGGQ